MLEISKSFAKSKCGDYSKIVKRVGQNPTF